MVNEVDLELTNEKIKERFGSQFELVGYAIKLAKNMILSGRAPRVKIPTENPASVVLEEIVEGKDQFEDVVAEESTETPAGFTPSAPREVRQIRDISGYKDVPKSQLVEKKKVKKSLLEVEELI